ncbi:type IV toxin-antitoxin system AbiEi family antitoxin [Rheinheimera baltica]|uniref:Type IV toxin-antitoxin system AbiEi family antitoxin n=1 Tax=Rheinheimera baltica TaxID=67576 RepID=A0ABT9I2Q3_9GAMM|nr:type IV toxin-antitoxin system AbiEi family antitoxin [Rheinheimera baltica]MDP5137236.1 type IV toxin-antitoxin system AbiEi family antitoxin [Rheinheimera baltica]MDP5150910.1 type IV toxin-antitoxin system AbiEi family antitoxin [Rheinheimera baltica]
MGDLLLQVADLLKNNTNLKIEARLERGSVDGWLTVCCAEHKYSWQVEAKNRLTRPVLAKLIFQDQILGNGESVLVAPYINENLAELCREKQLNFADLAGNAYLYRPPLYIDIRGRKPTPEHQVQLNRQSTGKAFQPKGAKLVMLLLLKPELVNAPMRVIANQAEIALGTVKQVLDDLKLLGFIVDKGKGGKVLAETELMLTRWLDAYPHNLAAKLKHALYTADDLSLIRNSNLAQYNALWGGEVAAEAYTHYLKPKKLLLYADQIAQTALLKAFRLRRLRPNESEDNAVEMVEPPIAIEKLSGIKPGMVNPLLVYAELLASNDPRNLETAQRLYHDYLA